MQNIEIFIDGSCSPINPGGRMGMGVLIKSKETVYKLSYFSNAKKSNTNNLAEYKALYEAIYWLYRNIFGMEEANVNIYSDSALLVNQMSGTWKIKKGIYKDVAYLCQSNIEQLDKQDINIKFHWIPREKNIEADLLSNDKKAILVD